MKPHLCILLFLLVASSVTAQQAPSTNREDSETRHDTWRKVPKAELAAPSDAHQQEILIDRGNWFDKQNPYGGPLDEPQPSTNGGESYGSYIIEDIPRYSFRALANAAVVVAKFGDYQPYLSSSRRSIYTDVKMSVEEVLIQGPTGISIGQTIHMLMGGGTIELSDGRVISDHIYDPFGYCVRPGHRYLFFLWYHKEGEFLTCDATWELLDGKAVPNGPGPAKLAEEGRSKYAGLSERAFIEAVRLELLAPVQNNDSTP